MKVQKNPKQEKCNDRGQLKLGIKKISWVIYEYSMKIIWVNCLSYINTVDIYAASEMEWKKFQEREIIDVNVESYCNKNKGDKPKDIQQ